MGMFNLFRRRRERESAIPGDSPDSVTRQLKGDGEPIGQPIGQALPQQANLSWGGGTDLTSIMAMMQQAFQSGNFQATQGENQVIDMRGSDLREQIMEAMRQHGIDPENATAQGQVNAADYQGMQQQIMDALRQHGIDVPGADGGTSISGGDEPAE
jgi:ferredoxin